MSKFLQKPPLETLIAAVPEVASDLEIKIDRVRTVVDTFVLSPSPEAAETLRSALVDLGEYVARDAQPLINEIKDVYSAMRSNGAKSGGTKSFDLSSITG